MLVLLLFLSLSLWGWALCLQSHLHGAGQSAMQATAASNTGKLEHDHHWDERCQSLTVTKANPGSSAMTGLCHTIKSCPECPMPARSPGGAVGHAAAGHRQEPSTRLVQGSGRFSLCLGTGAARFCTFVGSILYPLQHRYNEKQTEWSAGLHQTNVAQHRGAWSGSAHPRNWGPRPSVPFQQRLAQNQRYGCRSLQPCTYLSCSLKLEPMWLIEINHF